MATRIPKPASRKPNRISRRAFLKGTGLIVTATGAETVLSSCETQPQAAATPTPMLTLEDKHLHVPPAVKAMGPAEIDAAAEIDNDNLHTYQSTHPTGGAIMGTDPGNSVTNRSVDSRSPGADDGAALGLDCCVGLIDLMFVALLRQRVSTRPDTAPPSG